MSPPPRVRFAPSPTGYLHVGGARTALFDWLFARHHGGTFVLRIEDTDAERSSADMTAGILRSLRWLGLEWDEGPEIGGPHSPYLQSERLDLYRRAAAALVDRGLAYYCYCTPEELDARRHREQTGGEGWMYDRQCRHLTPDDIAQRESAGVPRAVRFFVPPGETTFVDAVHGAITIAHDHIEDFVLVRSDGQPTYQLSVVADDVEMAITHVVRGDDHISNTPKQILLYQAMSAEVPVFAHVPLILGPDKKRLSKRHGATSVEEYERAGYLPEAMINFLALLGWSPGSGDEEVFSRDELIRRFSLDRISGGNAVFNLEKLDWFNQQHVLRMASQEIVQRIQPALEAAGLWQARFAGHDAAWLRRVVDLVKPRVKKLADFPDQLRPFLGEDVVRDPKARIAHLDPPGVHDHLRAWQDRLRTVQPFEAAPIEQALRALAEARGVKAGVLIHATRVAVTGQSVSPGVFDVVELVGRERTIMRIDEALAS